ncbi:MAG: tetratricopeptide repeat protein [Candidatus Marinimicrobia bacterium]|nr:tetratricopeptide repeat protein [Candidatus Neomarinimicrobiota bacterium]MBL7010531.1 tetratricopeptide repeat protein [Candidatus Neomarinimicrobiota bacterium]MBL7030451.1 tetratricopeptide repeat protein [Candidatus Neomarinimicrobiota bacterium]
MLKRISIIVLLASVVFAQSPVDLYNSAITSLEAGDVSEAENGFNAALEADPTFAPAYAGLSRVAIRNGDLKQAGDLLKEAISSDEENKGLREEFDRLSELNTLMNKGNKSMKNGDADDAFESFRIAHEKFPNYPESVLNMGLVHFRKKEYLVAVDYFHETLALNSEHETALAAINNVAKNYFNTGNQSYKRGDLEGALSSYGKVLDIDKTFYQSHYQIGVIQSKMGDKDAAVASYEKALGLNPRFYKGFFALGLAKKTMGDSDGAIDALESAVDIHPGYDKAYGAMGDIYISAKNFEKAKQVLNMAITVNPNYAKGYSSLGILSAEEQNWELAISHLTMATTLNDRDAMSFFRLAGAYNTTGDCSGAKEAARKSTEIKSRFGGAWFELGIAEWCGGKGNKTGALNAFEKARNDRAWRKMAEYEMDKVKNPQKYEK